MDYGCSDGAREGNNDGAREGNNDGILDGKLDGVSDGASEDAGEGAADGLSDGASDGFDRLRRWNIRWCISRVGRWTKATKMVPRAREHNGKKTDTVPSQRKPQEESERATATAMDSSAPPPFPPPESPGRMGDQAGWASDIENSPRELLDDENRASEANEELSQVLPPLSQRAEPTLKERLVERERKARVETERARLKLQFALSSNGGAAVVEESGDMHASKENESVTGTLGEGSSVAALPTDHPNEDDRKQLGYVMERFLSERGDVSAGEEKGDAKPKAETGVVMKRFLGEPVLVEQDAVVEDDEEDTKMSADVGVVDPDTQVFVERGDVEDTNDLPAVPELHVSSTIDTHESMEAAGLPLQSYSIVTNNSLLETNTVDVDVPSQSARAGIPASVEEAKPKTET